MGVKRFVRQIPNAITVLRLLGSVALCALAPLSAAFYAVYAVCAVSDLADGAVARALGAQSRFGAALDSVADLAFAVVLAVRLFPLYPWSGWSIGWAAAIALLRIVTGIIGFIKYKAVPFRHTVANKVAGLLLYGLPVFALVLPFSVAILLLSAAATLASAEELALTLLSPALNRDEKGLLWRGKK